MYGHLSSPQRGGHGCCGHLPQTHLSRSSRTSPPIDAWASSRGARSLRIGGGALSAANTHTKMHPQGPWRDVAGPFDQTGVPRQQEKAKRIGQRHLGPPPATNAWTIEVPNVHRNGLPHKGRTSRRTRRAIAVPAVTPATPPEPP